MTGFIFRNGAILPRSPPSGAVNISRVRLLPAREPPFIAYNPDRNTGSIAGYSFVSQGADETGMHEGSEKNAAVGFGKGGDALGVARIDIGHSAWRIV